MLKKAGTLLVVLLCTLFVSRGWAEEGDKAFSITVKPGMHVTDTWGETETSVGEYDTLNNDVNHDVSFSVDGTTRDMYFSGEGTYYEQNDQDYFGSMDLQRYMTQEVSYHRFWHALEHDPLTNLYGATTKSKGGSALPPLVTYTDLSTEGGIMRSEMESKTTFRVPTNLPFDLKAFFNYTREARRGERQALTMSKCSACHVVGQDRRVDESTVTYNPGFVAEYRNDAGRFSAKYEYRGREFDDDAGAPTNLYDNAVDPGDKTASFENKVLFDRDDDALPYDRQPESSKLSHVAKLDGYLPSINTGLLVSGIYSESENEDEHIEYLSRSVLSRLSSSIFPGLSLNVHFKWVDLENDDTRFTAANADGSDPDAVDYLRESALSREQYEVGLDTSYLLRRGLTLRGSYLWRQTDRDDFNVSTDETETEENRVKVGLNARFKAPLIKKRMRARLAYEYRNIDDPFANRKAAFVGETSAVTSGTTKYSELQELRNTRLTNVAEDIHQVRADTTVPILSNLSLNAFYRYTDRENDSAEEWEKRTHMPSVGLWYAPLSNLSFNLSYMYMHDKTSSLIAVPVYNG